MSTISIYSNICCTSIQIMTREEEKELRDSYTVSESVKRTR